MSWMKIGLYIMVESYSHNYII